MAKTIEQASERYMSALHAMQSGVADAAEREAARYLKIVQGHFGPNVTLG